MRKLPVVKQKIPPPFTPYSRAEGPRSCTAAFGRREDYVGDAGVFEGIRSISFAEDGKLEPYLGKHSVHPQTSLVNPDFDFDAYDFPVKAGDTVLGILSLHVRDGRIIFGLYDPRLNIEGLEGIFPSLVQQAERTILQH